MSTTEYFFKFQSGRKKKLIVSQTLICFKCPSSVFSDLKNKKSHLFFQMSKSTYWHFMLKMNKTGVPLCFDQIKNSGLICFLGNQKHIMKNLPV